LNVHYMFFLGIKQDVTLTVPILKE
jgi:hypothetical protein